MVVLNVSYLIVFLFCGGVVLSVPLCLTGDFNSQLQHILNTELELTQDPELIVSQILDDVRATLSQRWQGFQLIPFGSLTEGLATKSSDLDISLRLPNINLTSSSNVFKKTMKLFQQQTTLYAHVSLVHRTKYVRCSFKHIPTLRNVDLVFHFSMYSEESVETSKLMKYYVSLDKRNKSLARFLIYFFNIHGVASKKRETLVTYLVNMLLIFYLQQKNMAPPVYVLQKDSKGIFVSDWDVSFNELPFSTMNTENLHQLLGGFFKYYSEFNFEEYIVSPYTGRPIPKSALIDGHSLPEEHFVDHYFNRTIQFKIRNNFKCADLCIQSVFLLDMNEGGLVTQENVTKFKCFVKSVAKLFTDLPSDSVLRAILAVDERKEIVTSRNNTTVNGINGENCIELSNA